MGKSSKRVTVGYRYYMGLVFGICHGPVDAVTNIYVGDRQAWQGLVSSTQTTHIHAGDLFGGDKKEGGVDGQLDIQMGNQWQGRNSYLMSRLGSLIPAFRGVLTAVFRRGLITSNNPYIKPWSFRVRRILQGWSGGTAWYPEKAPATLIQRNPFVDPHSSGTLSYVRLSSTYVTGEQRVAYIPPVGRLFAIREGGGFLDAKGYISDDGGKTWTDVSLPRLQNPFTITVVGSLTWIPWENKLVLYLMGMNSTRYLYTSPDGENWTVQPTTLFSHRAPLVVPEKQIVIQQLHEISWHWSNDGVNWNALALPEGTTDIAYSAELDQYMVIQKLSPSITATSASTDLVNWTVLNPQIGTMPIAGGGSTHWATMYDGRLLWSKPLSKWVVPGSSPGDRPAASSPDGINWTFEPFGGFGNVSGTVHKIIWVDALGAFIAAMNTQLHRPTAAFSLTGLGWMGPIVGAYVHRSCGWVFDQATDVAWTGSAAVFAMYQGCENARWVWGTYTPSGDMNPAHIIYECLTNTEWGMGYPTSSIDNPSFRVAADQLYEEEFGLSLLWNQQEQIEEFVSHILDHIGAVLYTAPTTGKFCLNLIRKVKNISSLVSLGPGEIVGVDEFQRASWGETVNEVTVKYTDQLTGKTASVTVHDLANIQTQGAVIGQTIEYPGITREALALRVAMRDLNAGSTPLAKMKVVASRVAANILPGQAFKITWPDLGMVDVVVRAMEVDYGTLEDGKVTIVCAEDIFALPTATYVGQQESIWTDPISPPTAASATWVGEATYWTLARRLSAADLAYLDNASGYLEVAAVTNVSDVIDCGIYANSGQGFTPEGVCYPTKTAVIPGSLNKLSNHIQLPTGTDLTGVNAGTYAAINGELVLVTDVNRGAPSVSISRGILDTVPVAHAAGSTIWFLEDASGFGATEYTAAETVAVRVTPRTGAGELDINSASSTSITFNQRHYRPYPPGNLRINGNFYGDVFGDGNILVEWSHRNRLQQTAYMVEQNEGSIGPEAGTTYNLRVYDENLTLIDEQLNLNTASHQFNLVNPPPVLRIQLWSVRGGLASWQTHNHVISKPGYGVYYGGYYGGMVP